MDVKENSAGDSRVKSQPTVRRSKAETHMPAQTNHPAGDPLVLGAFQHTPMPGPPGLGSARRTGPPSTHPSLDLHCPNGWEVKVFRSSHRSSNADDESFMQIVHGDTPLQPGLFYSWTISTSVIADAEIVIGICVSDGDSEFPQPICSTSRLGMDENSWVISNSGCISHNSEGAVHDNWKLLGMDHVTVYLNFVERTLSFAINGNHLGVEFNNIPKERAVFPVIGMKGNCSLQLKATYECPYNLELRSLLVYAYFKASRTEKKAQESKLPKHLKQRWIRPVPLLGCPEDLPVGLVLSLRRKYPWLLQMNVQRTKTTFAKSLLRRNRNCFNAPPTMVTFGIQNLSREVPVKKKIRKRRNRRCRKFPAFKFKKPCRHEKCFRFFRKRKIPFFET